MEYRKYYQNSAYILRCSRLLFPFLVPFLFCSSCGPKWSETEKEGYRLVQNQGGQDLGYSPESGVSILEVDRFTFKDLNQNGELDPYEDWRLSVETRATDLAGKMSIEQIAGLMLYSAHQSIPGGGYGRGGTYAGKRYEESDAQA